MREVRPNAPEYYGTADEFAAFDTTNLPTGSKFLVFEETNNTLVEAYVYVEGVGWCTL